MDDEVHRVNCADGLLTGPVLDADATNLQQRVGRDPRPGWQGIHTAALSLVPVGRVSTPPTVAMSLRPRRPIRPLFESRIPLCRRESEKLSIEEFNSTRAVPNNAIHNPGGTNHHHCAKGNACELFAQYSIVPQPH